MKRYIAILLLAIATPALAAPAFLQSCEQSTSVTGRLIWVGVYDYQGQLFTRTFSQYCPAVIQVY